MAGIFLSFSHKDDHHRANLARQLRIMGDWIDPWDDRRLEAGSDWRAEITKAIATADVAILLVSDYFLDSDFITNEEIPEILQRNNLRVIPFIVGSCPWKRTWLGAITARPLDGEALDLLNEPQQKKVISTFAEEIYDLLGKSGTDHTNASKNQPINVDLAKLPSTSSDLFGRDAELAQLDAAWADPATFVLVLQAWGGAGKTALMSKWLDIMAKDHYRGAVRVYGWSFYSQGSDEGGQGSADQFLAEALGEFGDPNPNEGSPWDKGKRLAKLVCNTRTLLVLDGLEPLQYPKGTLQGELKDQGLKALLKQLIAHNQGLCLITTRQSLTDLERAKGGRLKEIKLERLSQEAGTSLLLARGVEHGTVEELREAVDDYKGHALALTLLGSYIHLNHDGDITGRIGLSGLLEGETKDFEHANRVMRDYEKKFQGTVELRVLSIMGLFDRPADGKALTALRTEPAIKGLTDELTTRDDKNWNKTVTKLSDLGILAPKNNHDTGGIDAHPLVREHFGNRYRETNAKACREAHERLYEHYKNVPEKEYPNTLEEMAPLFAAVAHGCLAGKHNEVIYEVFWPRIYRGNEKYTLHKLGAFGTDLTSLANFFDEPWSQPTAGLTDLLEGGVLNWVGFGLWAMGRLRDAVQPFEASLEKFRNQKDWLQTAINAGNISQLLLTLGDINYAVEVAEESVHLADRSEDLNWIFATRTILARALHQAGRTDEAKHWFNEAEELHKKRHPERPYLHSLWGFWFCDLLLALGRCWEVRTQAEQTMKWDKLNNVDIVSESLGSLTLARATMAAADSDDFARSEARAWLDYAVAGLRDSGFQEHLTSGLLARVVYFRLEQSFENAQKDLTEVQEIAERGEMRLHLTDYHLESARLALAMGDRGETFKNHVTQAEKLIDNTGYLRRKPELDALKVELPE